MTIEANNMLIRIVDDDEVLRESLAFMLNMAGWETQSYPDARAFLTQDALSVPGCLILDLRMPGMSGLELLLELNRRASTLPVVFLTAHGEMDTAVLAMKKGAVDFISKPVAPDKLVEAVQAAMAKQQFKNAGLASPAEIVAAWKALTDREREICMEVSKARTNREVARRLHISERTVEGHRASAFKKLSVKTVKDLCVVMSELSAIDEAR